MQTMTPTQHEKNEWSRLATEAYKLGQNMVGHKYSVAASLANNATLPISYFDELQTFYRQWLLDGCILWPMTPAAMSPSTVDISTIQEYGLTQKLSNSIRCF